MKRGFRLIFQVGGPAFLRSAALFPVVKCVEVYACQIDRLTKAQNQALKIQGGSAPFFRNRFGWQAGEFFALPPSHTLPPKYFTSWERTRYASLLTSRKPSFRQQPRKDEQNHEHRHRPWLLRHQNPAFFFPSRYLGIFPRTLHPAEHTGVRREVFRVRDGQTADPAQEENKNVLTYLDVSSILFSVGISGGVCHREQ